MVYTRFRELRKLRENLLSLFCGIVSETPKLGNESTSDHFPPVLIKSRSKKNLPTNSFVGRLEIRIAGLQFKNDVGIKFA